MVMMMAECNDEHIDDDVPREIATKGSFYGFYGGRSTFLSKVVFVIV